MKNIEDKIILENNKRYSKTIEEIFCIFNLNKSKLLEKYKVNDSVNESTKNHISNIKENLGEITNNDKIEALKYRAITHITKYCDKLGIILPKDLNNHIKISLSEKGEGGSLAKSRWDHIYILNSLFDILSKEKLFEIILHEIIHIIANKHLKIFYTHNLNKKGDFNGIRTNISMGANSGYDNTLIGGIKEKRIGEVLNEGITQIITLNSLKIGGVTPDLTSISYSSNIYIIDGIIQHISKKTQIEYNQILKYLIKGNLLSDGTHLNIIKDVLGKDFLNELINIPIPKIFLFPDEENLKFIKKHKNIYKKKKLSKEMEEAIGGVPPDF